MQPRLLIVEGCGRGWIIYLGDEVVTVGRHGSNSVFIPDLAVSRRHFSVLREGGGFRLRDSGSRNGTHVNGRRVVEHSLREGDTIRAGGSYLVFLLSGKDEIAETSLGPVHLVDRGWAADSVERAM